MEALVAMSKGPEGAQKIAANPILGIIMRDMTTRTAWIMRQGMKDILDEPEFMEAMSLWEEISGLAFAKAIWRKPEAIVNVRERMLTKVTVLLNPFMKKLWESVIKANGEKVIVSLEVWNRARRERITLSETMAILTLELGIESTTFKEYSYNKGEKAAAAASLGLYSDPDNPAKCMFNLLEKMEKTWKNLLDLVSKGILFVGQKESLGLDRLGIESMETLMKCYQPERDHGWSTETVPTKEIIIFNEEIMEDVIKEKNAPKEWTTRISTTIPLSSMSDETVRNSPEIDLFGNIEGEEGSDYEMQIEE